MPGFCRCHTTVNEFQLEVKIVKSAAKLQLKLSFVHSISAILCCYELNDSVELFYLGKKKLFCGVESIHWATIDMGTLEPTKYGEQFHELYINCLDNR